MLNLIVKNGTLLFIKMGLALKKNTTVDVP